MKTLIAFAAFLAVSTVTSATFTTNCMKCICKVEGCEAVEGQCNPDAGSLSCGPYQIKEPYWIDCGRPGSGWQSCTMWMACSETCVRAYMDRYGLWCTGGRKPVCKDYAQIHNGGPNGCNMNLPVYWGRVSDCCNATPGGCD